MKKGSRVSWTYQGVRTYGTVTGTGGKRATITGPSGGKITRVGTDDDPVVRIKSESVSYTHLTLPTILRV